MLFSDRQVRFGTLNSIVHSGPHLLGTALPVLTILLPLPSCFGYSPSKILGPWVKSGVNPALSRNGDQPLC